ASLDPDHVGADIRDRPLDTGLRAFADGDHTDDRPNANDDAQHRQASPQDVLAQPLQGKPRDHQHVHAMASAAFLSTAATTGIRTTNVVPFPGALSTSIDP